MTKLLLAIFIFSIKALSCESVSVPRAINIAIDPENKTHYFYDDLRLVNDRPHVSAQNCLQAAREDKYLMFTIGLENFVLSDELMTYSINDELSMSGDKCTIENNHEKIEISKASRNNRLTSRRDFINKCIVFQLTDISESGISIPETQPGCKVTPISKYAANFEGSFCFIKPKPDSSISFHLDVKPECKSYEFFRENKIDLQDVLGNITVYSAGDASGQSVDLKTLKQLDLRVSVNPSSDLIETNKDYGEARPLWPSTWKVNKLLLSKPKINTTNAKIDEIQIPVLVNNTCEKKCIDGLCSSSCSYSQPVTGEFLLYDITKSREEFVYSWFDGGVAPANWSGILSGVGTKIPKGILEEGKRYKVIYDLSDQELNYMSLKGRVSKQIKMSNNNIPELNKGGVAIRTIPDIGVISEISRLPMIEDIVGIYFAGNGFVGVKNALNSISRTFLSSFWPPYFDKICSSGECISQEANKLKLEMTFKLVKVKGHLETADVKFSRYSNINNSLAFSDYKYPILDCGFVDTDTPSTGDIDFDF